MWNRADARTLQEFAISKAFDTPNDLEGRAFRTLPNRWAVALSVNR